MLSANQHNHRLPINYPATASSFFQRTMRSADHYGEDSQDSASDQEELVCSTDLDDDDDLSDTEEIQFTYCNNSSNTHLYPADGNLDNELCTGPSDCCCAAAADISTGTQLDGSECVVDHSTTDCDRYYSTRRNRVQVCGWAAALVASASALLIWSPLYLEQLSATSAALGDKPLNAYGALLFLGVAVTMGFFGATLVGAASRKWADVRVLAAPLPWKRLVTISLVAGVSSSFILISSYQRVACHLQDPLKGFTLAFAVIFYFIFCKKVMGLQKIFSATTSVVGLFISVDYGMCDAFRCRGLEIPVADVSIVVSDAHANGWQSRAVWTIAYIAALALWALHLSLLEGDVVSSFANNHRGMHSNRLLATVSRMVSIATDEPNTIKATPVKVVKKKPKALLVAAWIHLIALFVAAPVGLIDVIPSSGPITPWDQFWPTTIRTLLCHLNLKHQLHADLTENQRLHQLKALELLSNLTPGSHRYNETVQMLRRDRRDVPQPPEIHPSRATPNPMRRLNESLHESVVNGTVHLNLLGHQSHANRHNVHLAVHPTTSYRSPPSNATDESPPPVRKINTDKSAWHKLVHRNSNYIKHKHRGSHNFTSSSAVHNQTPIKVSQLVLNNISTLADDVSLWPIVGGSLMLSAIYVVFIGCALNFLFQTESAVFTVAVMSLALPLGGIFWSFFRLTARANVATVEWAPEVTGELICSMLGTPIVLLGICLFGMAHLNDVIHRQRMYTSLTS